MTAKTKPITKVVAVTKSDATVYNPPLRAVYVGGSGDLAVIAADDTSAVTLVSLMAGIWHPIECKQIMSTNTTATDIVGGY